MAAQINQKRRCVIIAGAPGADAAFLARAVQPEDYLICADRGYAAARAAKLQPDLIVGDFDSYQGTLPDDCEVVRLRPEKDDTDTMHCVNLAMERGYRKFLLLSAIGGRLDHSLANLCIAGYLAEHGASCIILSKNEEIRLLTEGTHSLNGYRSMTFSVFAFGCPSVTLTYEGAYYPLTNGVLTHSFAMGISNVFTADQAKITVHSGRALLLINKTVS